MGLQHVRAKQEGDTSDIKSSRQWAGFKNPRIVRVSRSFGGKDRHSKVCTIRGLRDRRIRLSVPSAVQLYDLQDRLGLNQPSKVVDWLLDNTKDDIDKLPPLPFGDFTQIYQQTLAPHDQELIINTPQSSLSPFFNTDSEFVKDGGIQRKSGLHNSHVAATRKLKTWGTFDAHSRAKQKEVERESIVDNKWNVTTDHEDGISGSYIPQPSAQNFLPLVNQFSFPGLMNNTVAYDWEPSDLSLSQLGNQVMFPNSQVIKYSQSSTQSVPPLAHPTSSQYMFYPPATTPLFAPQYPLYMNESAEPRLMSLSGSNNIGSNSFVSPFRFANPSFQYDQYKGEYAKQ